MLTLGVLYVAERAPRSAGAQAVLTDSRQFVQAPASVQASSRPVYPYSIVPGGVHSSQEVVDAMRRDPVVAQHYANVRPAMLREQQLEAPMLVHVSYRVADKVYWTKRKLTLQPGEHVLTDGTTTLRARCGNILSVEALEPALADEPPPPDFDLRVEPLLPSGNVPLAEPPAPPVPPSAPTPVADPPGPPGPPPLMPPGPPPPTNPPVGVTPLSEPPLPVPEPSTWILVGLGLSAGVVQYIRRTRRRT